MSNTNIISNKIDFTSKHKIQLYISSLIDSYKLNKLKNLNLDKIQILDDYNCYYLFILHTFTYLESTHSKSGIANNYKLSFYEDLITLIIDNLCKYKHVKEVFDLLNSSVHNSIYNVLTCTIHGHKHLNKIKKYISLKDTNMEQNYSV